MVIICKIYVTNEAALGAKKLSGIIIVEEVWSTGNARQKKVALRAKDTEKQKKNTQNPEATKVIPFAMDFFSQLTYSSPGTA